MLCEVTLHPRVSAAMEVATVVSVYKYGTASSDEEVIWNRDVLHRECEQLRNFFTNNRSGEGCCNISTVKICVDGLSRKEPEKGTERRCL